MCIRDSLSNERESNHTNLLDACIDGHRKGVDLDGSTPVSYTHLDVYKRQVYDFLAIALAELGNISERRVAQLILGLRDLPEFLVANPGPVSYTHLLR